MCLISSSTEESVGPSLTIGTRDGNFGADQALAVSMLRSLDRFKSSRLVRTTEPTILKACDVLIDVGGQYDPVLHRYDHQQSGFHETYDRHHDTKLSSAGLVYKHFGHEIVARHLGFPPQHPDISILVPKLYDVFIKAIDGIDNGIKPYQILVIGPKGRISPQFVRANYISETDLSSRIAQLNPAWNEPATKEIFDAQFEKAVQLAGSEFFSRLEYLSNRWLSARAVVAQALKDRFKNSAQDKFGRILVFDISCPWKDHLLTLERLVSKKHSHEPLYVVFPDASSAWKIQAIPLKSGGLELRKPLPEPWRGVRDSALDALVGIPGCEFVHTSGYIGGHQTFQGAITMAKKAADYSPKQVRKKDKGKKEKNVAKMVEPENKNKSKKRNKKKTATVETTENQV